MLALRTYVVLICSIQALHMHIGSLIKLNGTNYDDWVESVKLFLEISCVDAFEEKREEIKFTIIIYSNQHKLF